MPDTGMTIGLIKALGGGISEEEAEELRSAITNLLVPAGESVTVTNVENIATFDAGKSGGGFTKDGLVDGVLSFAVPNNNTEKSPYVLHNCAKGSGVWIVGFKYKFVKLNSSFGDPEKYRIYTGASEYQDDPVVYDQWVSFAKVFTGNLTRIRISASGYATAPSSGDIKLYLKEMYVYDAENIDSDMRTYIISQQNSNYQDGTVTYSTGGDEAAPSTSLTEEGKVADAKATGDAIKASGSVINVKYFGVKGNGTDDDTTAIRNLFTSKTGTFYFPAGTYKISGTLELPANSAIVGDGDTSIINMYVCTDLTQCTFRGANDKVYPYILITEDNCAVRHIKVTGSSTLYEARHAGIGVLDAARCSIEDVTMIGINYDSEQAASSTAHSGYGICVTRSEYVDVVKCDVQECGYECIGIVDDCNYCTVRDCYTQDGWRTCIQVHRGSCNTLIENNYMKQTGDKYDACFTVHGMTDQKIKNLRVVNNTIECTQNGDQGQSYCAPAQIMSHTDCLVFMGNRIKGGKRAFYIDESSTNAKIIGNDMNCNDTSDYGVTIASLEAIVIGNYLDNEATTKTNVIQQNPTLVGNVGIGS